MTMTNEELDALEKHYKRHIGSICTARDHTADALALIAELREARSGEYMAHIERERKRESEVFVTVVAERARLREQVERLEAECNERDDRTARDETVKSLRMERQTLLSKLTEALKRAEAAEAKLKAAERERDRAKKNNDNWKDAYEREVYEKGKAWDRVKSLTSALQSKQALAEVAKHWQEKATKAERALRTAIEAQGQQFKMRQALADRVRELRGALEQIWAGIGDALCSGSGIEKAYGHSIQRQVRAALEKGEG